MHDGGYISAQTTGVIEEICLMNRKFESPNNLFMEQIANPGR